MDNVVGFELVLPSGDVTKVTQGSNPDLFFALKVRSPFRSRFIQFPSPSVLFVACGEGGFKLEKWKANRIVLI